MKKPYVSIHCQIIMLDNLEIILTSNQSGEMGGGGAEDTDEQIGSCSASGY